MRTRRSITLYVQCLSCFRRFYFFVWAVISCKIINLFLRVIKIRSENDTESAFL